MLILMRRAGESVKMFDEAGCLIATVIVQTVKNKRASLAIDAKKSIRVLRGELIDEGEWFRCTNCGHLRGVEGGVPTMRCEKCQDSTWEAIR